MSPITYGDEPPPLVDAPTEFILFPPPEEQAAPRRQPHTKKKPDNHIPRPPNAFILFRSSFIKGQHVSTEVETNHSTLSKIIGITWQGLPEEERQVWHQKAKEALDEHKRKFPKYAFRPVQTKAKGTASAKRKVREVEPKDIKRCTKIAQLLVEGKKGHELDAAIQEFDKHHVPEIVTRFEAPITARAYRRSSSAPIPDIESSRVGQTFLQHVTPAPERKPRAASTRCSTPASMVPTTPSSVASPVIEAQALPLKQEASFVRRHMPITSSITHIPSIQNFNDFSFENTASPLATYNCDPLACMQRSDSFDDGHFNPGLTIDTNFMGLDTWSPSPMSSSPSTPSYIDMMSSSPSIASSPAPSYASSFDAFDQVHLEKQFNHFSGSFTAVFDPSCGMPVGQEPLGSMCGGGGVAADASLYATYTQQSPLGHIDLDFSAFMSSIPQYGM